jgi:hypothetical protein
MLGYVKNKEITVRFTNNNFVLANNLLSEEETTDLLAFVYISESDKQASKTIKSVGDSTTKAIVTTLIIIAILSSFAPIVSTIDLTGFLYYLLYIDARFPINIVSFYEIFKNF